MQDEVNAAVVETPEQELETLEADAPEQELERPVVHRGDSLDRERVEAEARERLLEAVPPVKVLDAPKPKRQRAAKPKAETPAPEPELPSLANGTIGAKGLKAAIARAERAIDTQPKRTEATLTDAQKSEAFKLGKAISADAYYLRRSSPDMRATTIAGMVRRIEERVMVRNAIRAGK